MSNGLRAPSDSRGRILIVDDKPNDLRYVSRLLIEHGYAALAAASPRLALAYLQRSLPDLILLDLNMPEMDGYELCRLIKSQERVRDVPVIFLSAENGALGRVRALSAGAVEYVTKPFQAEEILSRIDTHVSMRRLRDGLVKVPEYTSSLPGQQKAGVAVDVSHEMNVPLNAIIGLAQQLRASAGLNDAQQGAVDAILRQGSMLKRLVAAAPEFVRLDADSARPAPTDLGAAIQFVVDVSGLRAEERGLLFLPELGDDALPVVMADSDRLVEVLLILLGNAIRFTDRGSVVLRVHAAIDEQVSVAALRVEVEDTGGSNSRPDLDALLSAGEADGTSSEDTWGRRMATVRRIIRSMGSAINVEREDGKNTRLSFSLRLPLAVAGAAITADTPSPGLGAHEGPARCALIVDDMPIHRDITTSWFRMLGFRVLHASTGREALDLLQQHRPDIVLVDLLMPGVSGLQAIQTLRSMPSHDATRVIAIAANAPAGEQREALDAGADAVLSKPLDFERLLAEARLVLGSAKARPGA